MRYIATIVVSFLLVLTLVSASTKECFQESADRSTITDTPDCGLKYSGSYGGEVYRNLWVDGGVNGGSGDDINVTGWHDSDYLTFSIIVQYKPVYVNYSIPNNTISANWSITVPAGVIVETNSSVGNFSIPDACLNNILQIKIMNDYDWEINESGPGLFHASCWNYSSSNWTEFWTQGTPNVWIFEESIWWNILYDKPIPNERPIILVGNQNNQININETNINHKTFTKTVLDLTVGFLSLAIVLSAALWVYNLVKKDEITLKKLILIFAYIIIGLTLIQVLASIINKI